MTRKRQVAVKGGAAVAEVERSLEGLVSVGAVGRDREGQESVVADLGRQTEGVVRHPEHFQGLVGRILTLLQPLPLPRSLKARRNLSAKVERRNFHAMLSAAQIVRWETSALRSTGL